MEYTPDSGNGKRREPDVKSFLTQLRVKTQLLTEDIFQSKQTAQLLKSELKSMNNRKNEACNDLTKSTLDSIEALEREFKQSASEERTTTSFLKQQLAGINQFKLKLEQSSLLVDTRVSEVEKEIGIEVSLPYVAK